MDTSAPSENPVAADDEMYVATFSDRFVNAVLPKQTIVLPENSKCPTDMKKFISGTEPHSLMDGVRCPGCHQHYTRYKGLVSRSKQSRKDQRRKPHPNTLEEKEDCFICLTAEMVRNEDGLQCLRCPVCRTDDKLQQLLFHRCSKAGNMEVFVPPSGQCDECGYVCRVICNCPLCEIAPHQLEFRITPDPYHVTDDEGNKVLVVYPKYPEQETSLSTYDLKRRMQYESKKYAQLLANRSRPSFTCAVVNAELRKLVAQPDGYIVLAELTKKIPGLLDRINSSDYVKSKVMEEYRKDQSDQNTFQLAPNAVFRLAELVKKIAIATGAVTDVQFDVEQLINTIVKHNAVKVLTEEQIKLLQGAADRAKVEHPTNVNRDISRGGGSSVPKSSSIPKSSSGDSSSTTNRILGVKRSSEDAEILAFTITGEKIAKQSACVRYLVTLREIVFFYFKDLLNQTPSKEVALAALYTQCMQSLTSVLTIVVSHDQDLATKIEILLEPMLEEKITNMELGYHIANMNSLISIVNLNLQNKIKLISLTVLSGSNKLIE